MDVRVFSSLIGEPSDSPDEINDEEGSERPDGRNTIARSSEVFQ